MPSLSGLVRSISSAASSRSSDKSLSLSYTDTYFDEIGFKLGEHSCLGSTESPDNLDGEEILFYKDDRLFYESDDDAEAGAGADEEEEEEEIEDYGSHYEVNTTTTPTTKRVEMTEQLRQELDHAHNYLASISLKEQHHQQHQNSNSFSRGIQSYFAQLLRTDSLEYSPSTSNHRPFHFSSSNEKMNQKKQDQFPDLEISRTKSTLEESPTKEDADRNDDESSTMEGGMISSNKDKPSFFDDEEMEEKEQKEFRTKVTIKFLLLLGSFMLIVAIAVLLLASTQKDNNKKNAWNNTNANNNDTTSLIPMSQGWDIDDDIAPFLDASSQTYIAPTVSPSISPTAPPLTDTQEELLTILTSVSPSSKNFIRDHRESPQFQALEWLANDVNVEKYSKRRLVQRWVLATFYWSTNGDDWDTATDTDTATSNQTTRLGLKGPAGAEEGTAAPWMSQTHECEWYTTHDQKTICDGQERLVVLSLGHRNLRGTLPSELGLLTTLKRLYLPDNHIVGSIPTDLALLTKLESIHISSNLITGEIPSELGQLSALGTFGMSF
jgi:hypothetical protein